MCHLGSEKPQIQWTTINGCENVILFLFKGVRLVFWNHVAEIGIKKARMRELCYSMAHAVAQKIHSFSGQHGDLTIHYLHVRNSLF